MRAEAMQRTILEIPGQEATADAVIVHQQVEREVFDEEYRVVPQALLIERVQDGVAGAVSGSAGALCHLLAAIDGLSAERSLVDLAFGGARERDAVMFELQYRGYGLTAHIFDRILVAEPVGALDRVVHVETPIVAVPHVAERGRHAALRRYCMAARLKHLGDACGCQPRSRH